LIRKLCSDHSCGDSMEIRHLITKISTRKRSERVEIVFDYGLPIDEPQPEVKALMVTISDSILVIKELFNPLFRTFVNERVQIWRTQNDEWGLSFPSRTDVREGIHAKRYL
jgi:small-conductance mechanosensitive channel